MPTKKVSITAEDCVGPCTVEDNPFQRALARAFPGLANWCVWVYVNATEGRGGPEYFASTKVPGLIYEFLCTYLNDRNVSLEYTFDFEYHLTKEFADDPATDAD